MLLIWNAEKTKLEQDVENDPVHRRIVKVMTDIEKIIDKEKGNMYKKKVICTRNR